MKIRKKCWSKLWNIQLLKKEHVLSTRIFSSFSQNEYLSIKILSRAIFLNALNSWGITYLHNPVVDPLLSLQGCIIKAFSTDLMAQEQKAYPWSEKKKKSLSSILCFYDCPILPTDGATWRLTRHLFSIYPITPLVRFSVLKIGLVCCS